MSSPNITVHVKGGTTKVVTAPRLQVSGGGSSSNSFGVVNVATQNNITAVIPTDTLHVEAGTGILLTTNSVTSTLTIVATGGSATDQFARDQANTAFTKANTANVTGQAAFNHANSAYSNANTAIYTASQIRANISNTAPVNYDPSTGIISHALSGVVATTYGNTTFVPTITVDDKGHITSVTNTAIALPPSTDEFARAQANAAYNQANTANVTGQAAFDKANTANVTGQAAFDRANSGFTLATTANTVAASAYNQANIATTNADAAFARANAAYSNANTAIYTAGQIRANISNTAPVNYDPSTGIISHALSGVTASGYGDAATVPKVVVDDKGHVTSVTNTTIAISASAITSGTLAVARGGTGQTAITVNGSLLIGNTVSGGFDVNALTQGSGILITNDKGSITIAATGGAAGNSFGRIAVAGQSNVIAHMANDVFNLVQGTGIVITTDISTNSVTIAATGGSAIDQYARDKANGAAQNSFVTLNVAGQADIVADSNTDTLTLIGSGITITTNAGTDTLTIQHPASGVVASGYGDAATVPKFVVDANGHVTSVTNTAIAIDAAAITSGTLVVARGGTGQSSYTNGQILIGNTVSGGLDKTTIAQSAPVIVTNDKGTITLSHARSGVTAAVYGNSSIVPSITVDSNGHITGAVNTAIAIGVAAITSGATANGQTLIGNTVSGTFDVNTIAQTAPVIVVNGKGTVTLSHASSGVIAAVYGNASIVPSITVDAFGHITGAVNTTIALDAAAIATGILAVVRGGTGQSTYANGDLLIGNTASGGLDRANLTQGTGILVTNAGGKITIDASVGKSYYLENGTLSDVGVYHKLIAAPSTLAENTISHAATGTLSFTLLSSFITATGEPNVTLLPPGTYGRHLHATTGASNQVGRVRIELYKYAANTLETLLRSGDSPDFWLGNENPLLTWNLTDATGYPLDVTDRMLLKLYAARVSGPTTCNIDIFTQGNNRASYATTSIVGTSGTTVLSVAGRTGTVVLNTNDVTENAAGPYYFTAAKVRANISNTYPVFYNNTTGVISFVPATANGQTLIGNTVSGTFDVATIAQTAPVIVVNGKGTVTLSHASSGVAAAVYGNASIIPSITVDAFGHITGAVNTTVAISAAQVTSGTLTVAQGGTGQSAYTNGQILIGNTGSTGLDKATIAQSAPVIVTNLQGSITISHARSGVTAATYGSASLIPVITVDDNGHVTTITTSAASGLPAATANGQLLVGNTVSSSFDVFTPAQSAPIIVTVGKGTITYSHARSGVVALDSYGSGAIIPVLAIDANGHITAAVNTAVAISAAAVTSGILTVARGGTGKDATGLANGQLLIGNTVNTGFDLTTIAQTAPVIVVNGKGTITLSHASSTVAPAVYGGSNRVIGYTVDTFGHLTTATNVAIDLLDAGVITTGTLVVVRGGTGQSAYTNGQILIGNTGSTGLDKSTIAQTFPIIVTNTQGLINLSHASSGVTLGTYGGSNRVIGYTVDTFGHLTTASNVAIDLLPAAAITTGIISVARGGTGKDATGLVNGQILIGNTVNTGFDLAAITQTAPVIVSTDKGSIRLSHARSGVTAATYGSASLIPVITVDDNGHITVATTAAASGLPVAAANGQLLVGNTVSSSFDVYTPAQSAPIIVTVGKGTITYSHARSGVVALDSYGSGAIIPVLAIDANGHITAAVNTAVAISAAAITSGTLVQGRGGTGFTGASANGQTLIGNTVSGGFDLATLTAGTGININNLKGSIEIVATGGSATDQFARDTANGAFTKANGAVQTGFVTIVVAGQSDVVADSNTDTLTLVAGTNMTITTVAGTDTITLAAASGGVTLGLSVAVALGYAMP